MLPVSHQHGRDAEQYAAQFLRKQGLRVLAQNVRYKGGELDLVCQDGSTLVCIEVKYRQSDAHGHPLEAVTAQKLRRLITAFTCYLLDNKLNPAHTDWRIDVIAIHDDHLQWVKNVSV